MQRQSNTMRRAIGCGLTLLIASAAIAADGGTLEIKVGQTIVRTWDDVKQAGYAYGPKQEFDAATKETHIWLPYGSKGVYFESSGVTLSNPGAEGTGAPLVTSVDGNTSGRLVFKLHFDKPIANFRFAAGWSEWGVGNGTVGGVEYSVDGKQWKTLREVGAGGIVEPFADPDKVKATGLRTRELYLRCYSRDAKNPANDFGPGRWMKFRMAGDPAWGDAAETFFKSQMQLWVTAAEGGTSEPASPPAAETTNSAAPAPRPALLDRPAVLPKVGSDPRDDMSPWGIASGAEWSGDYAKFNPLLQRAGVTWLRYFPEWHSLQPRQGEWNFKGADAFVADAKSNNIHVVGVWCYFANWASADGGTRKGPVKEMQFWRDYVSGTVNRYQKDIKYWEVWNEFNGSFYEGKNKVKDYADLVVAAYDAAKKADPTAKVGMSVANFDVGFLDAAIKAGAADHFDFICVHPYENLGAVAEGGEAGYLSLAGTLRQMLSANKQRADMPLWITETGFQTSVKPDAQADARQAEALAKAYLLSLAQGFQRVCWFEARGPAYGKGTDHGIIRPDWSPRPAYDALKTLTAVLGPEPKYVGWLSMSGAFGFVFEGPQGAVLAAWAPVGKTCRAKFDQAVRVVDVAGNDTALPAGKELSLSGSPVMMAQLPDHLVQQARANAAKPFPWGGDYARAQVVTCRLGATNADGGIKQTNPQTTAVVIQGDNSCRRTDFAHGGEGHYVYFRVDPLFANYGSTNLEITVVARRVDKEAGMNLSYESTKGYHNAPGWWTIPAGDTWQEHTWKIDDANFVGQWGWNFRLDAVSSRGEILVKEVRVKKAVAPAK